MTEGGPASAGDAVARLWLDALGAIADRAAHDLRGVLNAVAVNLEVVRSRLARGAGAEGVSTFADQAAAQMELLVPRVEALLALDRPVRTPLDVRQAIDLIARLVGPPLATHGGELVWQERGDGDPTPTSADPEVARLVLVAALLAATRRPARVICRLQRADAIILYLEAAEPAEPLPAALLQAAAGARIGIEHAETTTTITLPAVPG